MRHTALLRTLGVLRTVQRAPHTLASLSGLFGVSARTIRRDLDVLAQAGFAVRREQAGPCDEMVYWVTARACPVCRKEAA